MASSPCGGSGNTGGEGIVVVGALGVEMMMPDERMLETESLQDQLGK